MKVECSQQYVSITPSGTPWIPMLVVNLNKTNKVAAMMVMMTKMRCCPSPTPHKGGRSWQPFGEGKNGP